MTRVLVTGANGHVGSHVVRAVRDRGWAPIAFVRARSDRRALAGLDVELREGDLLDPASVEAAMSGAEIVMHVGAVHRNFAVDDDVIVRPAVEGTRNVLKAARVLGIRRIVYTSTGATVGFAKDAAHPLDETHFLEHAKSSYIRGKLEAERLVRQSASNGLEIVILNPSGIFGPRDYRLTPATRAIIGLLQGDPAFLHLCITDVRDVALAHVRAAESGRPGERYLVTGEPVSPSALADLFADLSGIRPPTFRPPTLLLKWLVARMEKRAAREGSDAPASRDAIDDLAGGQLLYDSAKSRRELGLSYRSARDTLTDTFRWLLHVGALKSKVAARVRDRLGTRAAPDSDWV